MAAGQACPAPMRQSKTMSNFEDAAQDAIERSNTSPTRMSSGFRITNSEGKRASFQINEEPPKRSSGPAAARRSSGPAAAGTPEAAGERLIDLRPYVDRSPYVVHELQVRTHAPSSHTPHLPHASSPHNLSFTLPCCVLVRSLSTE